MFITTCNVGGVLFCERYICKDMYGTSIIMVKPRVVFVEGVLMFATMGRPHGFGQGFNTIGFGYMFIASFGPFNIYGLLNGPGLIIYDNTRFFTIGGV